jgi:hypothetical protein
LDARDEVHNERNNSDDNDLKTDQILNFCFSCVVGYGIGIGGENGAGYFNVTYNGVEEVLNENFLRSSSPKASFGCGQGNNGGGDESENICGNGVIEGSEECDDGNQNNGK